MVHAYSLLVLLLASYPCVARQRVRVSVFTADLPVKQLITQTIFISFPQSLTSLYVGAPGTTFDMDLVTLEGKAIVDSEDLQSGEVYVFDATKGYTIVVEDVNDHLTSVEFFFDGGEWTAYEVPYTLAGEHDGKFNPSSYLGTCGRKTVTVLGKNDNTVLFEEELVFLLQCGPDDECNNDGFTCPEFAFSTVACALSLEDCECSSGFYLDGERCVGTPKVASTSATMTQNCYKCPAESTAITPCPASLKDCQCSYTCPKGMEPYDEFCPLSEADCDCSNNDAVCPEGSVPTVACPLSPRDCTRVSKSIDPCDEYRCPPNSRPISECVRSIANCRCFEGFVESGSSCVAVPGMVGIPPSSPVEQPKACDFVCPKNAMATVSCPQSVEDCECSDNYFKNDDRCDSCIVPSCKWMETFNFETGECEPNDYPTTFPRIFECPSRSYNVQYRNTGTLLDCECNCNKPKNICTGWCTESCSNDPLEPGQ